MKADSNIPQSGAVTSKQLPSRIYVLVHSYVTNAGDPDHEDVEMKELYYSFAEEDCAAQIPYYREQPGFIDFPDGFQVMHIDLNVRYSEEGFFRW